MDRFPSFVTLRQLQYFLTVAEHLHFTKAAEKLAVTQPTLSHQIAQLEDHIGMQLFARIGRKVRLTEPGALLKAYADRAIKELQAGRLALSELEGMVRGELRIGAIQSFSRTLLPPILGSFVLAYPGICVDIQEMTGLAIEQALAAGSLDLGIGFAPSALDETEVEPMIDEHLLLVVGKRHRYVDRVSVDLAELDGLAMILLGREFSTRVLIDRYLAQAGAVPQVMHETNSMEVMLGMVAESTIATIIPEHGLHRNDDRCQSIPLCNPIPLRTSALLWPRHSFRSISARTFGQMMRDRFLKSSRA
jgi:LysR family cyn operon transcriptional activator